LTDWFNCLRKRAVARCLSPVSLLWFTVVSVTMLLTMPLLMGMVMMC
jgi:hypothetical protein